MQRRSFLMGLALFALAGTGHAQPVTAKLEFLTYPGTGKADIKILDFLAGIAAFQKEIERAGGQPMHVRMVRRIQEYEAPLRKKGVLPMLVYGPVTSAAKYMDAGYFPLVRVEKPADGMVVSKKPLAAIQSVVTPDPNSWLSLVGTHTLKNTLKHEFRFYYTSTQDAAAWALQTGLSDATVVRPGTLRKMQERDPAYKVILALPKTPDFTLLAHPSMTPAAREAIRDALMALPPAAIDALDRVYHVKTVRFVTATPEEYVMVRRIVTDGGTAGR